MTAATPTRTAFKGTRRLFMKKGTCSQLLFHVVNREFGHSMETEERAVDPLAGGIVQRGHQCGMLWGAVLGAGAEAYRRGETPAQATGLAIAAAQHLVESFEARARSVNCDEITQSSWMNPLGIAKYMLTGKLFTCLNLSEKWAPEAVQAARAGLDEQGDYQQPPLSCASEVGRRMGASEQEAVIVAGLAGGIGLSGHACGALGAAVWMLSLDGQRENPGKSTLQLSGANDLIDTFYAATDSEILCHKICGRRFATVDEHTTFIGDGGCQAVIRALAS